MTTFSSIAPWYALTLLVTVAFAPFAFFLFRRIGDHGAGLARAVALLAFVWPAWLLAGIAPDAFPFGTGILWVTIGLGGACAWILGLRGGIVTRGALGHFLLAEVGYFVAFAGYVWFRGYDPAIQGTEKFSDLMMLSSTMRAESMPPEDAWRAGTTINYYYVGYLPWASIARLGNIVPTHAYNLALASVFATTLVTVASVAANVVGRFYGMILSRLAGILAVLFLLMATPWAFSEIMNNRDTIWDGSWWALMWPASRQLESGSDISPAISEFPAFSFQLGDLHPHVLALPYTILALGFAWMLVTIRDEDSWEPTFGEWIRIIVAGGFIGSLYAMNSWDLPAYLLLGILGFVIGTANWPAAQRLTGGALLIVSAIAAWLPFHANFVAPTAAPTTSFGKAVDSFPVVGGIIASITGYTGAETTPWQYLGFAGFPWLVAMALIAHELVTRRNDATDPFVTRTLLCTGVALGVVGLLLPKPIVLIAGVPIVLVLYLWHKDPEVSPANVSLGLFGTGWFLMIVPDFLFLADIYSNRMNMVFKFYYQGWVMLAIASALAIVVLLSALRERAWLAGLVSIGTTGIVVAGLAGTVVGSHQWNAWRFPVDDAWHGVDGFAYMDMMPSWQGERGGIDWLLDNATMDDVMLSAGGCEFSDYLGSTAAATGVPTILGWQGHELQWHLGEEDFLDGLRERTTDINALWTNPDPALLDKYGVTLIYIGPTERDGSPANQGLNPRDVPSDTCASGPFPNATNPAYPGEGWTEVYNDGAGTRIYRRNS